MSGTNAQSPTAHTSGQSGTRKNSFTSNRPRSFAQGSEAISGTGHGSRRPHQSAAMELRHHRLKKRLFSVMLLTRVLSRISTPRRSSTFCGVLPQTFTQFRQDHRTRMHQHDPQHTFSTDWGRTAALPARSHLTLQPFPHRQSRLPPP